jgi:glycosyltransferase involved in cell wall biosynthesis
MTFCYVTDEVSPHELPLAHEMAARLDQGQFRYLATKGSAAMRRGLGWTTETPQWCQIIDGDEASLRATWQVIEQADVALFGNRSHPLLARRLALGRLTILGTERWFKPPAGPLRLLHPGYLKLVCRCRSWLVHPSFQFLAQGVYAARDMRRIGMGLAPSIRLFGYVVAPSEPLPAPRRRSGPLQVLWVGRMLQLKRVDTLIQAVGRLAQAGRPVCLTLVGHGPEEPHLRSLAAEAVGSWQLAVGSEQSAVGSGQAVGSWQSGEGRRETGDGGREEVAVGSGSEQTVNSGQSAVGNEKSAEGSPHDSPLPTPHSPLPTPHSPITFHPPVPITDVRGLMREADVYVLPSSGMEGWGVVVNEAMLEGCAVIASRESGSGATLIRDGDNGLLIPSGDIQALTRALERLEADEPLRLRLASAGQAAMLAEWTPSIAAERLLAFCEAKLANRPPPIWPTGPMSCST